MVFAMIFGPLDLPGATGLYSYCGES